MKRSLLALAVLGAFAGAASAQSSSVTIYGSVDAGITKSNSGTTNTAAANANGNATARGFFANNQWQLVSGNAPRLGFMGREDLGNGLYARFDIQHRFSLDTGVANSTFWAGRSIIAMGSNTMGEVFAGREYTPVSWVGIAADPSGWNYVSRLDATYTLAGYGSGAISDASYLRKSNAVGYRTPSFSGLKAEFMVAAGEGLTPKRNLGASLVYTAGPIYLGAGYDGMDGNNRVYALTGSYDFGIVKAYANYAQARGGFVNGAAGGAPSPAYRAKSASFGLSAPLGAGRLYASAGRYDPTASGVGTTGALSKGTKFNLGYEYTLSKRTTLYTNATTAKKDNYGVVSFGRANAFDLGVNHKF